MGGDKLAERYEQTMARFEQITRLGIRLRRNRNSSLTEILPHHPELKTHPIEQHSPLITWDAMYWVRTEAMRLHYKVKERVSIQYVDVMSLYPHICKYFKFPVCHPIFHMGDTCRDMESMSQKRDS